MVGQVYGWSGIWFGREREGFNFDMFTLGLSAYLVFLVFLVFLLSPSRPSLYLTYANA